MSESIQSIKFEPVGPQDKIWNCLIRDQKSDSAANIGERLAVAMISKTKEELTNITNDLDDETGNDLVSFILEAQDSLKMRLKLVDAAFARLCVVVEQDAGGDGDATH